MAKAPKNAEQIQPQGAASKWSADAKQAPRAALQFRSAFQFAAATGAATVPFTMTARTADPIDHWYWGRVVHDMAGMTLSKSTLPVDWCHDQNEILGFANKFATESGELIVSGELTPMANDATDRAAEVVYKQKLGVPYEASVDFSGAMPVIEYVPQGVAVNVNGKQFAGPGVVIREWQLRSVAVCPYGADSNTTTEFAAAGDTIGIKTVNKGNTMTKDSTTPAAEGAAPAPAAAATEVAAPAAAPATPATAPAAEGGAQQLTATPATPPAAPKPQEKYITAFGDMGARWFLEGKPLEDCVLEFTQAQNTKHAAELKVVQDQLTAANQKLAAIGRGDEGVTFSNADGANVDKREQKLTQNLGNNLGKFAASIKLPAKK